MDRHTYIRTIGILSLVLLGSLVVLDSCINANTVPVKDDTQIGRVIVINHITPAGPTITDGMIKRARAAGDDYKFLADKLCALQQAGNNVDIDEVDNIASTLNQDPKTGKRRNLTALLYAVSLNDPGIIQALCTLGANKAVKDAVNGYTPLHWAVSKPNFLVITVLLGAGIDVNAKDNQGRTPLIVVASNGDFTIISHLLDRTDIDLNAKDDAGKTALDYAITGGYELVQRALKKSLKSARAKVS